MQDLTPSMLALFVERKYHIHSGKVILSIDLLVVLLATTSYSIEQLLYSTLGFFVLTSVLGRYHKKAPISQQPAPVVSKEKAEKMDSQIRIA